LKLSDARLLFDRLKKEKKIAVRPHAVSGHPERDFSYIEIKNLILGNGLLADNKFPSAIQNSFLWLCRDKFGKNVELVVILKQENDEIIIVVSAWRAI
jgi:hypothetical protein